MFRYPFYRTPFPYPRYNYYTTNYSSLINKKEITQYSKKIEKNQKTDRTQKIEKNQKKQKNRKKNSPSPKNKEEEYIFDLFGIHIFLDDILIICLIFFLYNEGIKDEGLFIALLLLLLT